MKSIIKEQILSLLNEGYSYNKIQEIIGCSKSTISYHTKFKNRPNQLLEGRAFSKDNVQAYQSFYNNCGSITKTASHFGVHVSSLKRYIDRTQYTKKSHGSYYRRMKELAVEYKGGKCEKCGYNKSVYALDFHHRNPSQKEFGIAKGNKNFDRIKVELDKCDLLCKNCHAEEHEQLIKNKNKIT